MRIRNILASQGRARRLTMVALSALALIAGVGASPAYAAVGRYIASADVVCKAGTRVVGNYHYEVHYYHNFNGSSNEQVYWQSVSVNSGAHLKHVAYQDAGPQNDWRMLYERIYSSPVSSEFGLTEPVGTWHSTGKAYFWIYVYDGVTYNVCGHQFLYGRSD